MTDVRRADPAARRQAVLFLVVATCLGALLIVAFERYRIPLSDWVRGEPGLSAQRARSVVLLLSVLLLVPLLALAAYLWSLGDRVIRQRMFPPQGFRVIRDTPVITGEAAVSRGRVLQVFAAGCGIAFAVLGLLLWWLTATLGGPAA
jgi:hypothetical protein